MQITLPDKRGFVQNPAKNFPPPQPQNLANTVLLQS